jgi:hypothetical protein
LLIPLYLLVQDQLVKALLVLLPSSLLSSLVVLYLSRGRKQEAGETILRINSQGDWEYAPSDKRDKKIKFE